MGRVRFWKYLWVILKFFWLGVIIATIISCIPSILFLTTDTDITHLYIVKWWFLYLAPNLILIISVFALLLLLTFIVQRRASDEEIRFQQMAGTSGEQARIPPSHYDNHYREKFCRAYQNLDVVSKIQSGRPLDLEQVFVDGFIDPTPPHRASANPVRLSPQQQTGDHSIWKSLQASDLMVLGAAGSGKTMLVKHLGLLLVQRKRPRQMKPMPYRLPFLFFLRDLSTIIKEKPDYTLPAAVRVQTEKWQLPSMPAEWIEQHLAKGHCLILLDGLDEVIDPVQRVTCCDWIKQQMIAYAGNRFVITSRPYDDTLNNPLASETTVLEVQPFTFEQMTRFVNNWYLTNEIKGALQNKRDVRKQAEVKAQDLLKQLLEREALIELAVNPLLLTMITLLHYDGYQSQKKSLPVERNTLYKNICELFLGKWQEARGIKQELSVEQRQKVLQLLAYHMRLQGIQAIPCAEAENLIRDTLSLVSSEISPKAFLQGIQNSSGLLLESDSDTYSFAHLTFQEYLAAMHVRENKLEQLLISNVKSSQWHETIHFYCAQADATPIIAACLAEQPLSAMVLTLALECLQEAKTVQAGVRQQLNSIIDEGVEESDLERRHTIAEVLLARRLRQMRTVNERVSIDTSLVTHSEYQLFLDEERLAGRNDDHRPVHWTDSSFQSGAGRMPVLGVSQSSAQAFCRWLTKHNAGVWQYRLPNLEEWEQGAKSIWQGQSKEAGFWANQWYQFIWPEGEAPSLLQVQLKSALDRALALINLTHDRDRCLAFESALTRNLEDALASTRNVDITGLRGRSAVDYEHNMAYVRVFTLARDVIHDRIDKLPRSHKDTFAFDLSLIQELRYDPQFILDNVLHTTLKLKLSSNFQRTKDLDAELDYALDVLPDLLQHLFKDDSQEKNKVLTHRSRLGWFFGVKTDTEGYIARNFACVLLVYCVFFLLQKRYAGVLPAYEGILLVREHKEG